MTNRAVQSSRGFSASFRQSPFRSFVYALLWQHKQQQRRATSLFAAHPKWHEFIATNNLFINGIPGNNVYSLTGNIFYSGKYATALGISIYSLEVECTAIEGRQIFGCLRRKQLIVLSVWYNLANAVGNKEPQMCLYFHSSSGIYGPFNLYPSELQKKRHTRNKTMWIQRDCNNIHTIIAVEVLLFRIIMSDTEIFSCDVTHR